MRISRRAFHIIMARPPGPILDPLPWGKLARLDGNVQLIRADADGNILDVSVGHNLVTNDGELFYAYRSVASVVPTDLFTDGASPSVFDGVFEWFKSCATPPVATGTRATILGASGSSVLAKAMESGFPKINDDTTENDGKGARTVTYKGTMTTGEANSHNGIADLVITNPSPGASEKLLIWTDSFTAFNKTSSDSARVYVNHRLRGA